MDKDIALILAGIVFGLVAIFHIVRLTYKLEVVIGGKVIPIQASIYGLILSFILSIWMFLASTS